MRRAAKVDANHAEIADAFRKCGCSVMSMAAIGNGCPDLLVAINGNTFAVEVKDGSLPPSERRLTPLQEVWHREWRGRVYVVQSVDEAVCLVKMWRAPTWEQDRMLFAKT